MLTSNCEGMNVKIDYVDCPEEQIDCHGHLYSAYLWNPEALEPGNADSFILNQCPLMAATSGSTASTAGML